MEFHFIRQTLEKKGKKKNGLIQLLLAIFIHFESIFKIIAEDDMFRPHFPRFKCCNRNSMKNSFWNCDNNVQNKCLNVKKASQEYRYK